jgi:hypothetical protein
MAPLANGASNSGGGQRRSVAYFQYTGKTGLTVAGPLTGAKYRFAMTGDIVAVALADRPGVAAVPNLRQVAHP